MIKRFCDRCGGEVVESAASRRVTFAEKKGGRTFTVEVMVGVDNTMNSGDVCVGCVKELVMKAPMGTNPIAPKAETALDADRESHGP